MKQTLTINLNGIVFHIDDDAYNLLQDYLEKVENNLGNGSDVADVLQDIEARIGELFTDMLRKQGVQVVNTKMVEHIMQQLGDPDTFASDADSTTQTNQNTTSTTPIKRRLYRDVDDELLGGVCSGLAAYFGIDAICFRLLFVFCTFFYGSAVLLYLLLWIIIPAARTAAQRLEMRGIEPSVENIQKEVARQKQLGTQPDGCLRSGLSFLLKCFIAICLLFIIPGLLFVLFIIGVVLCSLVAALFGSAPVIFTSMLPFPPMASTGEVYSTIFFLLFGLSTVLIPIIMLIHWLITHFRKHEVVTKRFWWITSVLWVISLLGLGATTIYASTHRFNSFAVVTDEILDDDDYAAVTHFNELDAFHSIIVAGHADIDLSQNPTQSVSLQTTRPDLVEVDVRDSVLYITCKEHKTPADFNFTIAVPEVRSIISSGACSIEGIGAWNVKDLYLQAAGAAEIDLNVNAQTLTLQSTGASETEFKGTADNLQVTISGAGKVDAFGLQARTANVVCSGAGQVEVWVADTLAAQATGASKVEYRGTPVLTKSITGGMSKIRQDR